MRIVLIFSMGIEDLNLVALLDINAAVAIVSRWIFRIVINIKLYVCFKVFYRHRSNDVAFCCS